MITEFSGTHFPPSSGTARINVPPTPGLCQVYSHSNLSKDLLGIIGWCAFDYNTHADYGSGDKICYHGVMDMFRIPKYAAYVLRSQKNPEQEIVMEPTTEFSRVIIRATGWCPRLWSLPTVITSKWKCMVSPRSAITRITVYRPGTSAH